MREGLHLVSIRFPGDVGINGFGKGQLKTFRLRVDGFDFKGNLSRPVQPLHRISLRTSHRPTTIGTAGNQITFGRKLNGQQPRIKTFSERITRSLPNAVNLLGRGT